MKHRTLRRVEELFDDRLHLPGIARPVVLEECGGGLLVQGNCGSTSGKGFLRDEMVDNGEDILFPFPEGRNCNGKCIETVVQVGAKVLFLHRREKVHRGGYNELKGDALGIFATQTGHLAGLQDL